MERGAVAYRATVHEVKSQHDGSDLACTHTKPAVENPPDTFSISNHKDKAEWYTTKVIGNISLMPSTGRQKNENNSGNKQKPNSKMLALNRTTSIIKCIGPYTPI